MLAETDITQQLKDPAFVQWLIYALMALFAWDKIQSILQKRKATDVNVIGGELDVGAKKKWADKTETERALSTINARLGSLESQVSREYHALMEAGAAREEKIMHALHVAKDQLAEKIDHSLKESYHRINEHETRISRTEGSLGIQKRQRD